MEDDKKGKGSLAWFADVLFSVATVLFSLVLIGVAVCTFFDLVLR